jgi:large subunit ribosomal protein L29
VKPAEIRALSDAELLHEIETITQKLFTLQFQRVTQNLESTAELQKTRRNIARLRTILAERQRAAAASSAASVEPKAAEEADKK